MSKEVGEMVRSRKVVQAEASARTEGARRATGARADGAAAGVGSLAPGQRWSASRPSARWCHGASILLMGRCSTRPQPQCRSVATER